ncbi:MAG: hypothetical protein MJ157_00320 [Clostridia bacterium]|nr:hypothetical protein [Clostridia bacterium]
MLYIGQPVRLNGLEFDALLQEKAAYAAFVPEYPTEEGFSVQDSLILRPLELEVTLLLTNTPVTWANYFATEEGRLEKIWQQLEELYFSRQLCTLETSEKIYHNLALVKMTLQKNSKHSRVREIPLIFRQIRQTSTQIQGIAEDYLKSGISRLNTGTASTNSVWLQGMVITEEMAKPGSELYLLSQASGLFWV